MKLTTPLRTQLVAALCKADIDQCRLFLQIGADINQPSPAGSTPLTDVVADCFDPSLRKKRADLINCIEAFAISHDPDQAPCPQMLEVLPFMLNNGANPCLLTPDGIGPLFAAVLNQNTEVLRILLDHGADPNKEHYKGESLYDWAVDDYQWDTFGLHIAGDTTPDDHKSEEGWLRFLDRAAIKHNKHRPHHLMLLRERGAMTAREQRANEAKPT